MVIIILVTLLFFVTFLLLNFSKHSDCQLDANIGITTPNCPYCGIKLHKFPGKKTKCKNCGNYIYVRTRPYDNQRILIKSEQIEIIQSEWDKKNGIFAIKQQQKNEFNAIKEELMHKRNANFMPDNDVKWVLYQQKRLEAAINTDWYNYGFYTECMAKVLYEEKKYHPSLENYLEAEYFSICCGGSQNGFQDKKILLKYPNMLKAPFLTFVIDCIDRLGYNEQQLEKIFKEMFIINAPFPFTRNEAWKYLKEKLN